MYRKLPKKPKSEGYYRGKMEKKPKTNANRAQRKKQERADGLTVTGEVNSAAGCNFAGAPISSVFCYSFFLVSDLQS